MNVCVDIFFYSNFSALDERILSGFVPFGTVYTHESLLKIIKFGQVLKSNKTRFCLIQEG